jgi:hypothetical protein
MNDDLILALYPRAALAKDAKVSVIPSSPSDSSIGHIVKSKQEVDAIMKQAEKAGAKISASSNRNHSSSFRMKL